MSHSPADSNFHVLGERPTSKRAFVVAAINSPGVEEPFLEPADAHAHAHAHAPHSHDHSHNHNSHGHSHGGHGHSHGGHRHSHGNSHAHAHAHAHPESPASTSFARPDSSSGYSSASGTSGSASTPSASGAHFFKPEKPRVLSPESSPSNSESNDLSVNFMSSEHLARTKPTMYSSLENGYRQGDDETSPSANLIGHHDDHDDHHGHSHRGGSHGHSHGNGHGHGHGNGTSHGHSHGGGAHGHGHGRPVHRSTSDSAIEVKNNRRMLSPGSPSRACGGIHGTKDPDVLSRQDAKNAKARRALMQASAMCLIFMIAEVVGGFLANSLAIMTDAAHLLSDLAGFLISIFALWLSNRAPTSRLSYGFHRAEILGALVSVMLIWVLTGVLVYEACVRLKEPEDVDGKLMFIVATCGLLVNLFMGYILHQSGHGHSHGLGGGGHGHSHGGHERLHDEEEEDDHGHAHGSLNDSGHGGHGGHGGLGGHADHHDINVRAAFIHVVGDALQSVGVMIAGAIIWAAPEWKLADAITTFIFSILVLFTTSRLIKQAVAVLMEGVPEGLDPSEVSSALSGVVGVLEVHDLHIWSLSVGKPSLSVHLLTSDDESGRKVLSQAHTMLAQRFNIHHSTIQVEKQHDLIACNVDYE